ncbi:MAG: YfcE family phosphodiesterase [Candidatus Thorarchaeota archaeon]
MKRILVFGDAHVPSRADSIPAGFYRHIHDTVYDLAIVTGDLVDESQMRAVLPPLPVCHIVQGNMDHNTDYNMHEELTVEGFALLALHGTQLSPRGNIRQLNEIAHRTGSDIVIHGHTHVPSVELYDAVLFLNPGTITGATGGWGGRKDASFIELEISESEVSVTLFVTDWTSEHRSVTKYKKVDRGIVMA